MMRILCSIVLLGLPLAPAAAGGPTLNEQLAVRLDCSRVKTGLFYYLHPPGLLIIVERGAATQRQHRLYNKFFKIEKIVWISECDYTLQTVEKRDPWIESDSTAPIHISITRIYADYYEYRERDGAEWSEPKRMYFLRDLEKAISHQAESVFSN